MIDVWESLTTKNNPQGVIKSSVLKTTQSWKLWLRRVRPFVRTLETKLISRSGRICCNWSAPASPAFAQGRRSGRNAPTCAISMENACKMESASANHLIKERSATRKHLCKTYGHLWRKLKMLMGRKMRKWMENLKKRLRKMNNDYFYLFISLIFFNFIFY